MAKSDKRELLTDLDLLAVYKNGDKSVFREFYHRHYRSILQFSEKMCANTTEAEDVTQYCFLTLLQNLDKIELQKTSLKPYLFKMAQNKIFNHNRDQQKEIFYYEINPDHYIASDNPIKEMLSKELSKYIDIALAKLPMNYKQVLLLHDGEELTLPEIAEILGESVGAVKARLYRAREEFKSLISLYLLNNSKPIELAKMVESWQNNKC